MEYLIKKINMIDILGIILPGGLILLLLESDLHMLNYLMTTLGVEADKLLWAVIFLSISYFAGMLLHEAGSLIEKMMWMNPLLNPRVYAAFSTTLIDKYPYQIERKKKSNLFTVIQFFFRICAAVFSGVVVIIALGIRDKFIDEIFFGAGSVVVIALIAQYKFFFNSRLFDRNTQNRMRAIIQDEQQIRKNSGTTEESARKLGLFSGYYSMLRSILMMLFILQIYVYLQSDTIAGGNSSWLWTLDNTISKSRPLLFWRFAVVLFIVLRYWHYSCSRFIYIYNGYIFNTYTKPAEEIDKIEDRPIFSNARAKERDAQQAIKIANEALNSMREIRNQAKEAQEKAEKILSERPTDDVKKATHTILSLTKEAITLCDDMEKEADNIKKDVAIISDNVEKLSMANCMIVSAAKAVNGSSEAVIKRTASCMQYESDAKEKTEKAINLVDSIHFEG